MKLRSGFKIGTLFPHLLKAPWMFSTYGKSLEIIDEIAEQFLIDEIAERFQNRHPLPPFAQSPLDVFHLWEEPRDN